MYKSTARKITNIQVKFLFEGLCKHRHLISFSCKMESREKEMICFSFETNTNVSEYRLHKHKKSNMITKTLKHFVQN